MYKKSQDFERAIHYYKQKTQKKEIDLREVAKFAISELGWKTPAPVSALDRLAKEFARQARTVIRHDKKTGKPYRANHNVPITQGAQTSFIWFDIDEAPSRNIMLKSLIQRREQMIGDGLQLTFDQDHWNDVKKPDEEVIDIPMDLTDDILWRKNAPDEDKKAS
jgi:hypothetical protein